MTGLVSTIIPVFNRPGLLVESVDSVLQQTYRPIEIIIIDDGSTDNTPRVIRDLVESNTEIIRSLRQENSGPGVAREAGRQEALGDYIQYLDSDDLLLPNKFEAQVKTLQLNSECDIAYGMSQFKKYGQRMEIAAQRRTGEKHEKLFPALLMSRWWYTHTPLYRSSLTDRIGPWLGLYNNEDWEYDARAAALDARLCFCNEFVSVQRAGLPEQHLCFQGSIDPKKLSDRAKAQELILGHAMAAGISHEQTEMQYFSRALFLLSRQCGAAGLVAESRKLFKLARESSSPEKQNGIQFFCYQLASRLFGWEITGKFSARLDRLRPHRG